MAEKRVATIFDYIRFSNEHCNKVSCENCPVSSNNNPYGITCVDLLYRHTDKYNEFLLKWLDERPIKTYKDDFLEKHPNARLDSDGEPIACRASVYGNKCRHIGCLKCWCQPYEESEDEE